MQDAGRVRQVGPHPGHTKEAGSQVGLRNIGGEPSTLRRQTEAHQRVFIEVIRIRHSAPPLRRERMHLSVVGGPVDGAGDEVEIGAID
jgi:hypothetical protein